MQIILRCDDTIELTRAADWLGTKLPAESVHVSGSVEQGALHYQTNLDREAGESILTQLLMFPALEISARIHYDIPGRDHSWWGVTRYESVTDPDGTRRLESGSETHWA